MTIARALSTVFPKPSVQAQVCRALALCSPLKNARRGAVSAAMPAIALEDRCVDIGTGQGGIMHFCATRGQWTFVDADGAQLELAKELLQGEFICADALALLKRRGGFRLVTALDSLIYMPSLSEAVAAIH